MDQPDDLIDLARRQHGAGLVDAARDAERIQRLRRAGWTVVLVTDEEVWHGKVVVVARVRAARAAARRKLAHQGAETATR